MVNKLGLTFYINLLSVIATTYILTWYFLTPSPNRCQMTFMMEPPKFIPIEVEDDLNRDEHLSYPAALGKGTKDPSATDIGYKLYMYSEFGFPMASDVRRDLSDSMPVLFVPGNAGSYQQVRSLASTCIRKQLHSLEAFKFIFYTIDFGGQFSGISGQLIDRQTLFVQKSLRQITKMHPSDTEGVVLIGHSVGGFISKFLFTKPNFDPNSVPLMISLASPLTRPYLVLDDRMGEIYRRTEDYWNKSRAEDRDVVAISISGGGSDRLVPMHLSLDPHFDLSLTTESMRDVFLSTDHVCVTWCRELMHKLANLLSALMDKKRTRLIPDRSLKLSTVEQELLLRRVPNTSAILPKGDSTIRSPNEIHDIGGFHSIDRNQLRDNVYLFNWTSDDDLLICIDHIDPLKSSIVFGCTSVSSNKTTNRVKCHGRSDLMALTSSIPSSRYEPKRTVIRLPKHFMSETTNHVGIDCTSQVHKSGPPEMIGIQRIPNQATSVLRIPSLLESFVRKILFQPIRIQIYPRLNSTSEFLEIELIGSDNLALSVTLVACKCMNKGRPSTATLLYYRGGYMSASAFLSKESTYQQATRTTLRLRQSIMKRVAYEEEKSYLNIYMDGTCENVLELELNPLNLASDIFQKDLGTILSCIMFLLTGSIVFSAAKLTNPTEASSQLCRFGTLLVGSALVVVTSQLFSGQNHRSSVESDYFTWICLILVLSYGLLSFTTYFVSRFIDLAIIINNTHMILKRKVTSSMESQSSSSDNVKRGKNGISVSNGRSQPTHAQARTDFDWPMIGLAIASGIFLSSIPITVLAVFLLVKAILGVSLASDPHEELDRHCCDDMKQKTRSRDTKSDLIVNLIIVSSLVLVVNIPDLLLRLTNGFDLSDLAVPSSSRASSIELDYAAISLVLILEKLICDRLDTETNAVPRSRWMRSSALLRGLFNLTASKPTGLLTILPIILIESNIRLITTVALLLSLWLLNYLNFRLLNSN